MQIDIIQDDKSGAVGYLSAYSKKVLKTVGVSGGEITLDFNSEGANQPDRWEPILDASTGAVLSISSDGHWEMPQVNGMIRAIFTGTVVPAGLKIYLS
jgi:hypothetical protein